MTSITGSEAWLTAYREAAEDLPNVVAAAKPVLCFSNACIDVIVRLTVLEEAVATSGMPEAVGFFDALKAKAQQGVGGEVRWESENLPGWLASHPQNKRAIGGTGPQAAWALSEIGAPSLTALADRSAGFLDSLPKGIMIAQGEEMVAGYSIAPTTAPRPEIFIFEFSRGDILGGQPLPRSSRIIVRFNDPGLERDDDFVSLSPHFAANTVALAGGLGSVGVDRIGVELDYLGVLSQAWRDNGLRLLHLELGGYTDKAALAAVLEASGRVGHSLGMSASEFPDVAFRNAPTPAAMLSRARELGLTRLCVHADDWTASVTLGDPETERRALIYGSLLAASRANAGGPVSDIRVPQDAEFSDPAFQDANMDDGWSYVSVATPHLTNPAATLGLGDTFSAGCLLILSLG